MDALAFNFEIDIEEHFRIKDKADLIQARFHHTAVFDSKNDFIIVIGGLTGAPFGSYFKTLSHCELYRV